MDLGAIFLTVLAGSVVFFLLSHLFDMGDHGDAGGGHDHDGGGGAFTTDLLTLRNLFLFGVGYGAIGAIARYLGAGPLGSNLWGCSAGVLMAIMGALLYRTLRNQQSNTLDNNSNLVGKQAHVTTAIPEGGRGEITTTNRFGARVCLIAQSSDGPIAENSIVEVTSVVGNTATVKSITN